MEPETDLQMFPYVQTGSEHNNDCLSIGCGQMAPIAGEELANRADQNPALEPAGPPPITTTVTWYIVVPTIKYSVTGR